MGTKSNDLDLITVYLDEIGRFKKLTEDEEKDLIKFFLVLKPPLIVFKPELKYKGAFLYFPVVSILVL